MPVSRSFTAIFLSAGILLGSASIAQAQSDLPGCADQQVKKMVTKLIADDIEKDRNNTYKDMIAFEGSGLDWQLSSFSLVHITLIRYNELTGAFTCRATLQGKKDKSLWDIWDSTHSTMVWYRNDLDKRGYWEERAIGQIEYNIAQSAEYADSFIVSVLY